MAGLGTSQGLFHCQWDHTPPLTPASRQLHVVYLIAHVQATVLDAAPVNAAADGQEAHGCDVELQLLRCRCAAACQGPGGFGSYLQRQVGAPCSHAEQHEQGEAASHAVRVLACSGEGSLLWQSPSCCRQAKT